MIVSPSSRRGMFLTGVNFLNWNAQVQAARSANLANAVFLHIDEDGQIVGAAVRLMISQKKKSSFRDLFLFNRAGFRADDEVGSRGSGVQRGC